MILKALLIIVHFIIYVKDLCIKISERFSALVNGSFCDYDLSKFEKDSKRLKKLPIHLGLVFTEEELCVSDIAKILCWCLALGLPQVSAYDFGGYLKRHKNEIEECTKKQLRKQALPDDVSIQNSYRNSKLDSGSNKLHVNLVCAGDGRQSIADMTKHLSKLVSSGQAKTSDIETTFVDNLFNEQSNIVDPDAVITFGGAESLLGYLPWQTRLTEILSVTSHRNINYHTFYSTLKSFGDIKQRFGK